MENTNEGPEINLFGPSKIISPLSHETPYKICHILFSNINPIMPSHRISASRENINFNDL
jgi:hypothetical protein